MGAADRGEINQPGARATMPAHQRGGGRVRYDFEDHCWPDVVIAEDLAVYSRYERET